MELLTTWWYVLYLIPCSVVVYASGELVMSVVVWIRKGQHLTFIDEPVENQWLSMESTTQGK